MKSRRDLHLMVVTGIAALTNADQAFAFTASEKVFVAGSTGNTGKRIVAALRSRGIPVVAGVRVRGSLSQCRQLSAMTLAQGQMLFVL